MKLNEKIFFCRKRAGLSQEELANRIGVSRQAVSKWEIGTALPELDKLRLLAGEFGVTTDWLLSEDEEEPSCGEMNNGGSHTWVQDVPGVIGTLLRRYGWLSGIYVALLGLGFTGMGLFARTSVKSMFSQMPDIFWDYGVGMGDFMQNNPVYLIGNAAICIGLVMVAAGVILAVVLRKKSDR